jgi:hypothetical protein
MDLIKQYIIQTISFAANNLRLSSEKIEVVTMLREVIANSDNVEDDLKQMKKITELSTIGIRLYRTHSFLMEEKLDFTKLSETFKEQSKWLVNDLSHLLDNVTPQSFKEILDKTFGKEEIEIKEEPQANEKEISIDLSKRDAKEEDFEFVVVDKATDEKSHISEEGNDKHSEHDLKDVQKKIKTEEKEQLNFEDIILKTVNSVDSFLEDITNNKINKNKIEPYLLRLEENQQLSLNHNLYLVGHMHSILFDCLSFIKGKVFSVNEELIDYMRGCLIVIAAIIRRKDVDISNYLNKAEILAAKIRKIKEKELVK